MMSASAAMFAASTAMIRLDLISEGNNNDYILMVENSVYTTGRDQSGDIQKPNMPTANPEASVQLYALTGFADYERAGQLATSNLDGVQLGFITNSAETSYSIKVTNAVFGTGVTYYLIDKCAGTSSLIEKDFVYGPFTAPAGSQIDNRFEIRALSEVPGMTINAHEDPEKPGDYYSTFYHGARDFKLPAGIEAYVAQVLTENLELTQVADGGEVIPHGVAFILKSNAATINLANADAEPVAISVQNDLRGLDYEADAPATCYIFSGHSTDNSVTGIGFYLYEGAKLAANKAYVTPSGNAPRRLRFVFTDGQSATALDNVKAPVKAEKFLDNGQIYIRRGNEVFNLQGQLVK